MAPHAKAHRASAQRRRVALLKAAAELAAEVGAGAVTHRAVAARAGVPLSTTSYFFDSIDDLVTEALRTNVQDSVDTFDAAEQAWVLHDSEEPDEMIERVADALLAGTSLEKASQVELFLAARRNEELRLELSDTVVRMVERTAWQLDRYGGVRSAEMAWALVAFVDGAMLHRLASVDTDHRERLVKGMRLLIASAMLTDADVDALLARLGTDQARSDLVADAPEV